MNDQIQRLAQQIRDLEKELRSALQQQQTRVLYDISGKRIRFERAVRETHRRLKVGLIHWLLTSRPRVVLSAPFIYSLVVPAMALDLSMVCYQAICFRLYGIARIRRSDYIVIDRHQLAYLNSIEKLNCVYCGYMNGLFAYGRELASRTEQYWCPIKHARRVLDTHSRYALFADYGDAENYHIRQAELQQGLIEGNDKTSPM